MCVRVWAGVWVIPRNQQQDGGSQGEPGNFGLTPGDNARLGLNLTGVSRGFIYLDVVCFPLFPFSSRQWEFTFGLQLRCYLWRSRCHSPKGLWSRSFCAGTRSPTMKVCFSRTCVPSVTWFCPGPCDSCPTWPDTPAPYFRSWRTTSSAPTSGSGSSRTK